MSDGGGDSIKSQSQHGPDMSAETTHSGLTHAMEGGVENPLRVLPRTERAFPPRSWDYAGTDLKI